MAARLRHGGTFSLISLTFGHFLYKNVEKAFSFRGPSPPECYDPHQGLCPWTPLGLRPTPPFMLALRALAMVPLGKSWIRRWN